MFLFHDYTKLQGHVKNMLPYTTNTQGTSSGQKLTPRILLKDARNLPGKNLLLLIGSSPSGPSSDQ